MEIDAEKIIRLNTMLSNLIEGFDELYANRKINLTIKDKILVFLMQKSMTPIELIKFLGIAKSNLALISQDLIKEELINKTRDEIDRRNIVFTITEKGKERAKKVLEVLNKNINTNLAYKDNANEINLAIENLIKLII
ncbi:MAG: MarR family transcriptional regulator [Christensenellales bacterium]